MDFLRQRGCFDDADRFDDDAGLSSVPWLEWYGALKHLAKVHRVSVADQDAWRPEWHEGRSPEDALYAEYPEFRPAPSSTESATEAAGESGVKQQHRVACKQCPFRRNSAPGWLGSSEPGEFLALADSELRTPCHLHVDYESADWKAAAAAAPQCVGRSVHSANRCKQHGPDILRQPADRDAFFARPHEFVAHHAGVDPSSLESALVFDLYKVRRRAAP